MRKDSELPIILALATAVVFGSPMFVAAIKLYQTWRQTYSAWIVLVGLLAVVAVIVVAVVYVLELRTRRQTDEHLAKWQHDLEKRERAQDRQTAYYRMQQDAQRASMGFARDAISMAQQAQRLGASQQAPALPQPDEARRWDAPAWLEAGEHHEVIDAIEAPASEWGIE